MKRIINMLSKNNLQICNKSTLFRELGYTEKLHSSVYDYRDISKETPINELVITCEHATNNFHQFEHLLSDSDKKYIDTHWGWDPGAKDIALKVAEKSKTLFICPNFSRLILDPNRSLISDTLIRDTVEGDVKLDINKPENQRREERLNLFYVPYYNMLYEVFSFLKPRSYISIHSFTKQYENLPPREYEIGLLYNQKSKVSEVIEKKLTENGYNYRINEPYGASLCNACYAMENYDFNKPTEGVLIEVRNDLATNEEYSDKLSNVITESIEEIIKSGVYKNI